MSPGLSELLKKDGLPGVGSFVTDVIHEAEVRGLSILTAGATHSGSMSLLYGARMTELLEQLRPQFDTIVIDTPPMLQISDARVLGRVADCVVFVIRAGYTTRDAAQAALRRFREDGTNVLGSILNDWNPKKSPDGFYGYYGGYYRGYLKYYGHKE